MSKQEVKPLSEWEAEANDCHLDYGNYRAAINRGKTYEELLMATDPQAYEASYPLVESALKRIGSLYTAKTYETYDAMFSDLHQYREIRIRLATAKIIRKKHLRETSR